MSGPDIILDYKGKLDFSVIDKILEKFKKSGEIGLLNTLTRKRVYSILVECLENIANYSLPEASRTTGRWPHVRVEVNDNNITVEASNPIPENEKPKLVKKLDRINKSDESSIRVSFEKRIRSYLRYDEKCAGLGFLTMAIKSGNKLTYSIEPLTNTYSLFRIIVTINKFNMRKLIIEKTSNSPKVILDPDNNTFLIEGESRPPDVREFYSQVISWLQDFSQYLAGQDPVDEKLVFNFNLEYFNSSSAKMILDICKILSALNAKGINISVRWYFEREDGDMLEVGREMARIVKLPFEFVEA